MEVLSVIGLIRDHCSQGLHGNCIALRALYRARQIGGSSLGMYAWLDTSGEPSHARDIRRRASQLRSRSRDNLREHIYKPDKPRSRNKEVKVGCTGGPTAEEEFPMINEQFFGDLYVMHMGLQGIESEDGADHRVITDEIPIPLPFVTELSVWDGIGDDVAGRHGGETDSNRKIISKTRVFQQTKAE